MMSIKHWQRVFALLVAVIVFEISATSEIILAENDHADVQSAHEIEKELTRGLRIANEDSDSPPPPRRRPSVALPAITFEVNSSQLTPMAVTQLQEVATALRSERLREKTYRIEGHTDATGTAEYNQWLSQRRAERVREYLLTTNTSLSTDQLTAVGFGESRLADKNEPKSEVNRRVELVMTSE